MDLNSNKGAPGSFDLIGLSKQIIKDIDSVRSINTDKDSVYDESRVNAFLRMIGLPMFVVVDPEKTSGTIINTGYRSYLSSKKVENMDNVSNLTDYENLKEGLFDRENNYIYEENRTDEEKSNDMSFSLRSMIPLSPVFINSDSGQWWADSEGEKFSRNAFKMLFPLIPSYKRINPPGRNVARPFSNDVEVDTDTILKKPFIETVIIMRSVFGKSGSTKKGKDDCNSLLESIRNSTTELEYAKISKMVDAMQSSGVESFVVQKIFDSLLQVALRYTELRSLQENLAQTGGNFVVTLQTESANNPMGKKISSKLETSFEDASKLGSLLSLLKQRQAEEQTYLLLLSGDSSLNTTSSKSNASDTLMSSMFVDLLKNKSDEVELKIKSAEEFFKRKSVEADSLRLEVDLITGEFIGLSVVDVIAVIASLFLIEEEHLYALLDEDTKKFMLEKAVFKKQEDLLKTTSVDDAAKAVLQLQKYVTFVYGYINSIVESVNDRTKRNITVIKNNRIEKKTKSDF